MGAACYTGNTTTALKVKNGSTFRIAVGRTTAWAVENTPPAPVVTTVDIEQIQGFKLVDVLSMCVLDNVLGTIEIKGNKYRLVTDNDSYTEGARYLYFKTTLLYAQYPLCTFRQIGVYVDTIAVTGHETDDILSIANTQSNGRLLEYENIQPVTRNSDSKNIIEMVYEFRGEVI